MSLFNILLESISINDLNNLITNSIAEGRQIDYKREISINNDSEKKEFLADVASFATASGGDIIFGIDEDNGIAIAITPVTIANIEEEKLRFEGIIRNGIEPRINFFIKEIPHDNGYILIIRILKSFQIPVMVKYKNTSRYYSRNSTGKYQLDYNEIKHLFQRSATIKEEFIRFRNSRIDYLLSGEDIDVISSPILLFHLYPLNEYEINFDIFENDKTMMAVSPISKGGFNSNFNLEGYKTYLTNQTLLTYTQVFKNGGLEFVDNYIFRNKNSKGNWLIPLTSIEIALILQIRELTIYFNSAKIIPPFILSLVLLNVANTIPHLADGYFGDYSINKRNNLIISESIAQSDNKPLEEYLKPIFDELWRAYGLPRSINYNRSGQRI